MLDLWSKRKVRWFKKKKKLHLVSSAESAPRTGNPARRVQKGVILDSGAAAKSIEKQQFRLSF